MQSVINDRESGIVPENPSESYQSINALCDDYGIHSSVGAEYPGQAAESSSSPEGLQTSIDNDGSPQSSAQNPDTSVQAGKSEVNDTINDGLNDNITWESFSPEAAGYIDDGFSSFSDEPSTSADQTNSFDDGLSSNDVGVSSGSSLSSDGGMSDGIE